MRLNGVLYVILAVCVSALLSAGLNSFTRLVNGHWAYSLAFLALVSLVINRVSQNKRQGEQRARLLLGAVIVRMLLSMVWLLLWWIFTDTRYLAFALHFLAHYVLFSIAEARYLSKSPAIKT